MEVKRLSRTIRRGVSPWDHLSPSPLPFPLFPQWYRKRTLPSRYRGFQDEMQLRHAHNRERVS